MLSIQFFQRMCGASSEGIKHFLSRKEGCTQGSGCVMQAYVLPFIQKLKNPSKWIHNWYADDGSSLGKLKY